MNPLVCSTELQGQASSICLRNILFMPAPLGPADLACRHSFSKSTAHLSADTGQAGVPMLGVEVHFHSYFKAANQPIDHPCGDHRQIAGTKGSPLSFSSPSLKNVSPAGTVSHPAVCYTSAEEP